MCAIGGWIAVAGDSICVAGGTADGCVGVGGGDGTSVPPALYWRGLDGYISHGFLTGDTLCHVFTVNIIELCFLLGLQIGFFMIPNEIPVPFPPIRCPIVCHQFSPLFL